jgi:MFS family permease
MKTEANGRGELLRTPNFRWLMAGSAISLLGDQFTLVALPWLVLHMTGDTVALGLVLALIGVPRAVLMLLGGALVDRLSPQRVLMVTKYINTVLLGALALGVQFGAMPLTAVYVLALAIGISSAFGIPSATSMLPHALPPSQLAAANGAMMGLRQISMFAGPLTAGVLIAVAGDGRTGTAGANGLALAFGLDALSFALSAWTLAQVKTREPASRAARGGLLAATWQGLRHVWNDTQMRACYLYWGAVAVLVMGPLHIALPVLAHERAGLGASALGLMLGAHGAGTLAGMVVAGTRPSWRIGTLGTSVLLADALVGLLCVPLGFVTAAWQGAALMLAIGVVGGFLQVAVFTWMQRRAPAAMVGRATSLFMFIFMGLVPLASAVTGVLMRFVPLSQLFAAAGLLMVLVAGVAWAFTPIRRVSDQPA